MPIVSHLPLDRSPFSRSPLLGRSLFACLLMGSVAACGSAPQPVPTRPVGVTIEDMGWTPGARTADGGAIINRTPAIRQVHGAVVLVNGVWSGHLEGDGATVDLTLHPLACPIGGPDLPNPSRATASAVLALPPLAGQAGQSNSGQSNSGTVDVSGPLAPDGRGDIAGDLVTCASPGGCRMRVHVTVEGDHDDCQSY